ncbi:hypothetical protein BEP19_15970 [Ammoniphilus oxalaticus]|uniref:Uncharacterized protein n=1 Tax=Ammoniphilus oxalaticus TaxID=66863 RepID=A0A419SQH0_9BACL|nr:hypothetical protein [Ammoniphilus oxalaticus]RKD26701.1 hypothetical protein BEP19_15970 [Ammoniphilus oxalaticus]
MKKYIGAIILLVLSPLLLSLIIVYGFFHGVSVMVLWFYDFIYWPIYELAGNPFDQRGQWKWNRIKK